MSNRDEGSDRREGFQNPLTHEGVAADPEDSNERADDKVRILQPDGEPIPEVERRRKT